MSQPPCFKKQKTLAAFGFTKTVSHRGVPSTVDLPTEVDVMKHYSVECENCKGRFKNTQGLGVHKLSCLKVAVSASGIAPAPVPANQPEATSSTADDVTEANVDFTISAMNNLPAQPGKADSEEPNKIDGRRSAKGAKKRQSYSSKFKAEIIHQCQPGTSQHRIAEENCISQALISKWLKNKDAIISDAIDQHKKLFKKQRPSTKYKQLYIVLYERMKAARNVGKQVNFNWLWTKARQIYREQTSDDGATVRKHVITSFLKKYNVRMRTKQRNRAKPRESYREDLMKWHATTRERLVRTAGSSTSYDPKWGYYKPEERFNVDQTPMPFAIDVKRTYEIIDPATKKYHKTWIKTPGSGLEKRQCTVQVCTRAAGKQPPVAIIFRGKGNVRPDEKAAYHPRVHVYWQDNAWADTEFSVEWTRKTLGPVVEDLDHHVLFADNLTAQTSDEFKAAVRKILGIVWYGLANATELWQVVDAGVAQTLKVLTGHSYHAWLDQEENADRWFCHEGKLTASERRILITQWVGDAWDKLCTPQYDNLRLRCWQKTGCLITADGSDDDLITPEGLPNYAVPPPLDYLPVSDAPPTENTVGPSTEEEEDEEELEGDKEEPEDDGDEWVDNEDDRYYDAEFVGRKIKGFYETGWQEGTLDWYNDDFRKYRVSYPDGSEDYISLEDIDGVELILLD